MRSGWMFSFALVSLLAVAGAAVGRPQQHTSAPVVQQGGSHGGGASPFPTLGEQEEPGLTSIKDTQAKLRNDERQKRLVSDTDKLLALATQLHADVAKTNKNILSIDVIRRTEEIEKLARGIKDRMKS